MAKKENQKLKILYLLKILCNCSAEGKTVTMPEILNELASKYGIIAERKSIYSDLEALRDFGINVVGEKRGKLFSYCIKGSTPNRDTEQAKDIDKNVLIEREIDTVYDSIENSSLIACISVAS